MIACVVAAERRAEERSPRWLDDPSVSAVLAATALGPATALCVAEDAEPCLREALALGARDALWIASEPQDDLQRARLIADALADVPRGGGFRLLTPDPLLAGMLSEAFDVPLAWLPDVAAPAVLVAPLSPPRSPGAPAVSEAFERSIRTIALPLSEPGLEVAPQKPRPERAAVYAPEEARALVHKLRVWGVVP